MTVGNESDMYKYLFKKLNMVDGGVEVTLMLPTEAAGVHVGKCSLLAEGQVASVLALVSGKLLFHLTHEKYSC